MSEKPKRKGTPIHPYVRVFAAFLPCIGIGILELVFFMSTGYICAAFPLSIVALVVVGNLVWKEEHAAEEDKPKRGESEQGMLTLALEDDISEHDEGLLEHYDDGKTQRNDLA
jgi:hypothetical protein